MHGVFPVILASPATARHLMSVVLVRFGTMITGRLAATAKR